MNLQRKGNCIILSILTHSFNFPLKTGQSDNLNLVKASTERNLYADNIDSGDFDLAQLHETTINLN